MTRIRILLLCLCAAVATARAAENAAVVRSEFIYETAAVPQCHASTIVEAADGGLVAAWFGGTRESHVDVGIWVSRFEHGRWSAPVEVANGVQPDGTRYSSYNPVLFQPKQGPLVLFYKTGPDVWRWWGMRMTSIDGGRTWSPAEPVAQAGTGPSKNKPLELADGTLVAGTETGPKTKARDARWRLRFLRSTDLGRTWTVNSDDNGKSWGPVGLIDVPNSHSGTDAVKLRDGRYLLVYNHSDSKRYPLNVAISADARSWRKVLTLEEEPNTHGYAYPAVIQTRDGLVHVTYTWDRARIRHAIIDPAAL